MDLFSRSWTALRAAVGELSAQDCEQPSGCAGWLVRDLVCHLIIDAQDTLVTLITLVTPADTEPTVDDVGSAAGRAADPAACVSTRGEVLTVADYLAVYVVEWTMHHLDLIAYLPSVAEPPAEGLAAARASLEKIAGAPIPASFSDKDALLIGTGRRGPTGAEQAALGELAAKFPLRLG